jgi:hypothetical protein
MYCAYGDESRDETHERVYAVAAVFGRQEEFDEISGPWQERLEGKIFHAADCEFGHGEFKDLGPGECRTIYRDLTRLIVNSKLCGHGIAINIPEYNQSFPHDFEHAPYLWAFADVIKCMAELAGVSLPSGLVEVTFDRNEPIEYNATSVYELMRRSKAGVYEGCLADKISFACRRTVGIQMADLFARETMKQLDRLITGLPGATRLSFTALQNTRRFSFIPLRGSHFENRKQELARRNIPGSAFLAYQAWLKDKRLLDCLSNRIAYLDVFPELQG